MLSFSFQAQEWVQKWVDQIQVALGAVVDALIRQRQEEQLHFVHFRGCYANMNNVTHITYTSEDVGDDVVDTFTIHFVNGRIHRLAEQDRVDLDVYLDDHCP